MCAPQSDTFHLRVYRPVGKRGQGPQVRLPVEQPDGIRPAWTGKPRPAEPAEQNTPEQENEQG